MDLAARRAQLIAERLQFGDELGAARGEVHGRSATFERGGVEAGPDQGLQRGVQFEGLGRG